MGISQIQSKVSWIKHYQEERLHVSPAMVMEEFRLYTRDGFSVSVPAPIMVAFSSLAKRLFIPKTGGTGQDIFLPSVRGRTLLLLVDLLRSGTANDIIGPEESMKEVQDLMQLLEIHGRMDMVRIDKGNSVNYKKHIQKAPLDRNISSSKSKSKDRNGHGVRDKQYFSNLMASRDTDGDREFSNCKDTEHVQTTLMRYDKLWDKKIEEENGHLMVHKEDFSNILMVSSETDDDSDDEHFQSAPNSLDNAMARNVGNVKRCGLALHKPEPDSSNVLVLSSTNTNEGRVFRNISDNRHLPSKSSRHNKASKDGEFLDGKGLCALDKPNTPNINLVSSNDKNLGSERNTWDIGNHSGQNDRFRKIGKFPHEINSESRTRKRFWPETVLLGGSRKNLMKMSQENGASKLKCESDIKVSKFTMKRSCDVGFDAMEVSDEYDNDETNGEINNNANEKVFLENEKDELEALVEGHEELVKESTVEESIPAPQIEFLAQFNLCTHAQAEQVRARMALKPKPTTSRLKRSRTKKNK